MALPGTPNLLVIDTQGSELKVLTGAKETLLAVDGVFVEISEQPLYKRVVALMRMSPLSCGSSVLSRRGNHLYIKVSAMNLL